MKPTGWPSSAGAWRLGLVAAMAAALCLRAPAAEARLLNASFDISRELFEAYNAAFKAHWKEAGNGDVAVEQSHGGSAKQARAVVDGLEADVVTLNQASDIDQLAARRGLVAQDWRARFPGGSAPFSSVVVFLVRKGNPKALRDWDDLARPGVSVILPNPRTSGNGRCSYLAAYAHARGRPGATPASAESFVAEVFAHVPVTDVGGRAATATFVQRSIGDVLLTFEAEARLALREAPRAGLEVVYPALTFEAEMPVAVVERNAERHGNARLAKAYLDHLFSAAGQEIIAAHGFRPRSEDVRRRHAAEFPDIRAARADDPVFGGWKRLQEEHFAAGGVLDRVMSARR